MPRLQAHQQPEPFFVSDQVTEARRYYLNLNPRPKAAFEVVCGGVERMKPDYLVRRHDFPFYAVELVVEGEGSLVLNGRRFRLEPGVVFAYGPGVAHTIRNSPSKSMRKYYIDFAGLHSLRMLEEAGLAQWTALRVGSIHELVSVFDSLADEARYDTPLARKLRETLFRLLFLKIQQHAIPAGRSLSRAFATYARLKTHVEEHALRLRTVDDIASECHVTAMYISRLFRRFGGTGAYQFLLRLKMNHAAQLLDTGLLVKETAARLGFADAFQFSRAFKRIHGVPPNHLLSSRRPVA